MSGFNVEYGSLGFAVIFIAEYGIILFISLLFSYIFIGAGITAAPLYLAVGAISSA